MAKDLLVFAALLLSLSIMMLIGATDIDAESQEEALYAEMVCLGIATDNEFGWPNYKNLDVTCGE